MVNLYNRFKVFSYSFFLCKCSQKKFDVYFLPITQFSLTVLSILTQFEKIKMGFIKRLRFIKYLAAVVVQILRQGTFSVFLFLILLDFLYFFVSFVRKLLCPLISSNLNIGRFFYHVWFFHILGHFRPKFKVHFVLCSRVLSRFLLYES